MRRILICLGLAVGLVSCAPTAREIWIGHRSDGRLGNGSQAEPFDGSTQPRFDGVLRRFTLSGVEGLTVNLLPGIYETYGNGDYIYAARQGVEGWRCNSGWTIRGAGVGKTVVKLAKLYPDAEGVTTLGSAICTFGSPCSGVTVEDLTVDCNDAGIGGPRSSEGGVSLYGTHHTIRRLEVINAAGRGLEAFPILIACNDRTSSDNLIEACSIRNWRGGQGGSITMANNVNNLRPPLTWTSGIVRLNRVEGSQIAYGGWGMDRVLFENNQSERCAYGVNVDSMRNQRVRFVSNSFSQCTSYGMVFANCSAFEIRRNTISLDGGNPYFLFLNNSGGFSVEQNVLSASKGTPLLASMRDPSSATGTFFFDANQMNPVAHLDLPAHLVAVAPARQ